MQAKSFMLKLLAVHTHNTGNTQSQKRIVHASAVNMVLNFARSFRSLLFYVRKAAMAKCIKSNITHFIFFS